MPIVAVLHHLELALLGHAAALREAGIELDERFHRHGDELPALEQVDGIVSLGGEQTAGDAELEAEAALLRAAVKARVPVLAVCLGGQLLAHALGARVWRPGRRVEWRELSLTGAAAGDPLFGGLEEPVPALHWNQDVFDLPPGAEELLAGGRDGVEAFRAGGRAWGIQYHPDADAPTLERWLVEWADQIADPEAFAAECRRRQAAHDAASRALFEGFARVVDS